MYLTELIQTRYIVEEEGHEIDVELKRQYTDSKLMLLASLLGGKNCLYCY